MEIQDQVELCFPHLLNTSCRKPTLHWFEAGVLNILLSSISVITVALNLLVIIAVSHFRQLHTPTNILLLSLAVSDFLVGLLLMPVEIFRKSACWVFGDAVCVFYSLLSSTIVCSSIGQVVLISIDRYVAICYPMHYPTRVTVSRACAMRSQVTAVTVQVSLKKFELKAARTLGILVVVYLICYCPLYCYALIGDNVISFTFVTFVIFFFYLNSCLNPVIYALFYPWFRRSVKHIVTLQILKPGLCEVNTLERDC
ncbi:trace amine-associated receptor 13c-like [Mugil cephalus]|uniref:trace amine-associated receptor 13c-like n=1 Tax=Mugil cephalus TaxID=48193 RepID=UPI001FB5DFDD|nr:trace amine-associated receptor 13c-like [Mugil cephalus]